MSYVDPINDGGLPASGKVITSKQAVDIIIDIEYLKLALTAETQSRINGDTNLQSQINTINAAIASLQAVVFTNVAPTNILLPSISGTNSVGSTLTINNGTWSNNPTSYAIQWYNNSVAISGAVNTTYILQNTDAGANITGSVTATNGQGSATAFSLPLSIPISSNAPILVTSPTISGSNAVNGVLTAAGTWNNVTSYGYQWNRNGTPITNATNANYTVTITDQGTTLTCTVTAINSSGTNSVTTPGIAIAAVVAPFNNILPAISGTLGIGNTLTASQGTWS